MNKILVEVSVGELLDKISILEIKKEKIKDLEKLKFINDEYSDWIEGKYQKSPIDNIDSLSRESLTKRLLDIINKINS